ncbi:hypothetical protein HZY83_05420 [Gemella sp. GH3]|uniref:hypothetical protein n=1 Tax=unclassified Gemella TaxID=2624949 RepID=UPI0015CFEEB9|nr:MULTISPECIES: hypothetical protein [unclassified Gemella]MBF0714111.1 hypothetical protein [Gemella sp. GH3.1]NYS51063.1 hypothetical protein [Gemella sp. GH3]
MQLGQARATNSIKYQNIYTNMIITELMSNIEKKTYPNYKMKQEHLKALNTIYNDLRRI